MDDACGAPCLEACTQSMNEQSPFSSSSSSSSSSDDPIASDEHRRVDGAADTAHIDGSYFAADEGAGNQAAGTDAGHVRRPWSRGRQAVALGSAAALILGVGTGIGALSGAALGRTDTATGAFGQGTASGTTGGQAFSGSDGGSGGQGFSGSQGFSGGPGFSGGQGSSGGQSFSGGQGSSGGDGSSGTSASTGTTATAAQQRGVVTIVSQLQYERASSAGTGIVLSADGEILTNNHVVAGATSIAVTVESTGRTYTAKVVGTDATHDIAVLQLQGASGLTTASISSDAASVGDDVTAVGNAEGGGTLIAAKGQVTALKQAITTAGEGSADSESLTGLIETDADVVSGDSGGPLLDTDGQVVGIDTAASSGTSDVTGYAIAIAKALSIAEEIEAGRASSTITIGTPGFLGVEVASDASSAGSGATVGGVIDGTPADTAGLEAGDVVTAVDGTSLPDASSLSAALRTMKPGTSVTITYTDTAGASHTATVTLATGPAA